MQKNWIGRSEGLTLRWETVGNELPEEFRDVTVYTTVRTRCSARPSWRLPQTIRWRSTLPQAIRPLPSLQRNAAAPARRWQRWKPLKRRAWIRA